MAEDTKKKTTVKKTTAKKTTTKTAAKKTTTKKPADKKAVAKKTSSTKSSSKKTTTKKPSVVKDAKVTDTKKTDSKTATQKAAEAASKAKSDDKSEIKKTTKKGKLFSRKKDAKKSKDEKKTWEKKKLFFGKKKKAPKLVEPKIEKNEIKKPTVVKRVSRKTRTMRKRGAWVVVMVIGCAALVIGGFKIAGAFELNAGYACKVGDTYTREADVTKYISEQTYYKQYSKSVSQWTQFLSMYGMTPEKFREQVIKDKYEHEELVRLAAEKEEVTVDEAEVDKHMESFKAKYDNDANYQKALETAGYTEETYRDNIYKTILEKNLTAKVVHVDNPSDDDVKTYLSSSSSTYKDARRSSHILFKESDHDKAQSVLDQINAGTLSFEDAVNQYSTDEATKSKGGDVGWDKLENLSSAYTDGLSGLGAGQVCNTLVTDKSGIHIIKCTEKWDTPEKIESLDGVPQAIIDKCREKKKESNEQTELKKWLETFATDNGIETSIFPMPSNVPYNVDTTKSKSSSSSSSSTSSAPVSSE